MIREKYPAVFLDRDGVLCRSFVRNGKPYAPRLLKDFRLLPNSINSILLLKQAGFKVIVVTNQPDIGNGLLRLEIVETMHQKLYAKTMVDEIMLCPHCQDDGCECRKPNPGMLLFASEKHKIDISKSFMVGDRASDIEAGKRAGCLTIFIDRHYAETRPTNPDVTVNSLLKAVSYILANHK
ncbi:MAG: HAD family hydrolase [Ignavibacteriales bacterium]|nr:HAD family hydrolase [Ignavibacteriales bacterium]